MGLQRYSVDLQLDLTDTLSTTPVIRFGSHAGGFIYIPSGSSITSITWHVCPQHDGSGTFLPASDEDSTAITQTVAAGEAHEIPRALFGAGALKAVVDNDGAVEVSLKG